MVDYSFGLPGYVIWILHIIIAFILIYIGWNAINDKSINKAFYMSLIVLGFTMIFYHLHLGFYYTIGDGKDKTSIGQK